MVIYLMFLQISERDKKQQCCLSEITYKFKKIAYTAYKKKNHVV